MPDHMKVNKSKGCILHLGFERGQQLARSNLSLAMCVGCST